MGLDYFVENGTPLLRYRLSELQMTDFPQSANHTEFNPGCTEAVFVASLASGDPGVQQSAQRLLCLDHDLVNAAFGSDLTVDGRDVEMFRGRSLSNVAKVSKHVLQSVAFLRDEGWILIVSHMEQKYGTRQSSQIYHFRFSSHVIPLTRSTVLRVQQNVNRSFVTSSVVLVVCDIF